MVAEGVESARTWTLLRQWRCDDAQGYLIGRPMPLAALPAWMDEWQAPETRGESNDPPRLSVV